MSKSFTLVEVLIALLVVSVGVGGAIALVGQTSSFASNASSQLTATFLAQEGIEIARNIRDSNFLRIHNGISGAKWDDGMAVAQCSGGCEADYTNTSLSASLSRFLNLANGLYSYAPGAPTIFKRTITIVSGGTDMLNVSSQVTWQERGRTHAVSGATTLYNWLTPSP